MSKKQDSYETKRMKSPDGTIAYIRDGKLHNWDGPAYIPEGNLRKAQYYIHGIEYTKDDYNAAIKDFNGLPWYKSSSGAVKEER